MVFLLYYKGFLFLNFLIDAANRVRLGVN